MQSPKEIMAALQAPFKPDEIEWMVKTVSKEKMKGLALPYVSNRAIQKRLDETVGIENWKNEFIEWKEKNQLCGISIRINGEWITKYDGASDTNVDGTKGGISGSMKRAAVQWGIGRYLYNIPEIWADVKQIGAKGYKITKKPTLPKEFLPEDFKVNTGKWEPKETENLNELPKAVQKCLDSFKEISISKEEIENYLHLEADMISDAELRILRNIYLEISHKKKKKEDYFFEFENPTSGRSPSTLSLEKSLEG